jgi:hypothetical protein
MIGHYHTFEDYIQVAAYGGVYGDDAGYGGGPYPNRSGQYGSGEDAVLGSRGTGARFISSSVNRQVAAFGTGGLNTGTIDAAAIKVAVDACNALRSHDHNISDAYGNDPWNPFSY